MKLDKHSIEVGEFGHLYLKDENGFELQVLTDNGVVFYARWEQGPVVAGTEYQTAPRVNGHESLE